MYDFLRRTKQNLKLKFLLKYILHGFYKITYNIIFNILQNEYNEVLFKEFFQFKKSCCLKSKISKKKVIAG